MTLSNAHIGLGPPKIENDQLSPYDLTDSWSPGGIYGPFERPLTFYRLYQMQKLAVDINVDIACAGGIVSDNDAVQAILLGATVVEISSGIQWRSTTIFKSMNDRIVDYLLKNGHTSLSAIRGFALPKIKESADAVSPFMQFRKVYLNQEECRSCTICTCIDRLCFAISRVNGGSIIIDSSLCNGCGWCVKVCRKEAIHFVQ